MGVTAGPRYHLARRDYGQYAALRARLTDYAQALTGTIDAGQDAPIPVIVGSRQGMGPTLAAGFLVPETEHTVSNVRGGLEPAEPDVPSSGRST